MLFEVKCWKISCFTKTYSVLFLVQWSKHWNMFMETMEYEGDYTVDYHWITSVVFLLKLLPSPLTNLWGSFYTSIKDCWFFFPVYNRLNSKFQNIFEKSLAFKVLSLIYENTAKKLKEFNKTWQSLLCMYFARMYMVFLTEIYMFVSNFKNLITFLN